VARGASEVHRDRFEVLGYRRNVRLHFIEPGTPVQNALVESFNGKFRDQCLNEHWFVDLNATCAGSISGHAARTATGIRPISWPRRRKPSATQS
jgi:hypothetical protein